MTSKLTAGLFLFLLGLGAAPGQDRMPDFGPDGLAGLKPGQVQELASGGIILPEGLIKSSSGTSLIEAALLFDQPPAEVWRLLSETEVQDRYLPEIKALRVIWKKEAAICLEFTVRVMGKTVVYRAIHEFYAASLYFRWFLDPDFRSDLKELTGFWRFYPFGEGRTLARYGSVVKPRFPVPGFIRAALAKGHVRSALESVKKYVDSGGVWRVSRTAE